MTRATIAVRGLREYQRALKKLDADLPKGLRLALNQAAELLVSKTVPKIPRRTGRAAASLKARSTRTAARVAVGGRRAAYYPWLDFGGRVGRGRSVARQFIPEGRYIYPTLAENRDEITTVLERALVGIAQGAGVEVR